MLDCHGTTSSAVVERLLVFFGLTNWSQGSNSFRFEGSAHAVAGEGGQ